MKDYKKGYNDLIEWIKEYHKEDCCICTANKKEEHYICDCSKEGFDLDILPKLEEIKHKRCYKCKYHYLKDNEYPCKPCRNRSYFLPLFEEKK